MMNLIVILPVILPLVLGYASLHIKFENDKKRTDYAIICTAINSIIVFIMLFAAQGMTVNVFSFTDVLNIRFKIDGLGCVFAAMVSFLWPLATVYASEYMKHEGGMKKFFAFYLMTFGVTVGLAFSANMLTMYLCYEGLTFITLPLVTHSMDKRAEYAGKKYIVYSVGGASLSFIGMMLMLFYNGSIEFAYGGVVTNGEPVLLVAYLLMFIGFGVKAAIFPLHGWLPAASVAPTTVTALLHAVAVVKAGVFAIMRTTYYFFGTQFLKGTWVQDVVMCIAIVTVLFGSWTAARSRHLKRRFAYSTVSQLSYILFGVTLMTAESFEGSMAHMLFHGLIKIVLFYTAGAILYTNHREYVDEIEGFARKMKKTFWLFTLCSIALIGIPPLPGFLSKFTLATSAVSEMSVDNILPFIGICALMFSAFMTAVYLFEIIIKAYFPSKCFNDLHLEEVKEAPARMFVPMAIISAVMVSVIFWANPLFDFLGNVAKGGF
ncbi:MAG: NADH dehydrogenase [Oscillospiraceae bacterium]|nr:NADH dehydrogenase [Oscillospiraceae bacterium]